MNTQQVAVDVVIVNYNAGQALRLCIESILASEGVRVRCIVVDNHSSDDSLDSLAGYTSEQLVVLRNTQNLGFSKAVNQGVAEVRTPWFWLLNPDTQVEADALATLLKHADDRPRLGVLGGLVVNPDGSEQRGCRRDQPTPVLALAHGLRLQHLWPRLEFNHTGRPLPPQALAVEAISGSCMLINRAAHDQLQGFDEGFFLHFEDLDYCARLSAAGWSVWFVPQARILHVQGVSSAKVPVRVIAHKAYSMVRFFWKHGGKQRFIVPLIIPLAVINAGLQVAAVYFKRPAR